MDMKRLRQFSAVVGDVQRILHLHKDLRHAIIRDSEQWYLGGVHIVRR